MAQNESDQERTEEPTAKRLREARDAGQVLRSREFNSMAVMITGGLGLIWFGPGMVADLRRLLDHAYRFDRDATRDTNAMLIYLQSAVIDALSLLAPFLAVVFLAALLAPSLVGGWSFSSKAWAFKLERLNPLKGMQRIFSTRGLFELAKSLAKFLLVAALTALLLQWMWRPILGLRDVSFEAGIKTSGDLLVWAFLLLSAGLVVIAAIDAPMQIWQHYKQLRMTRQEVRDEMRDTEGKPEVKSRIRSMQQQLAQARMMEAVPKADVVITNPTHVAVALRYDDRRMRAPIVVAKGVDLLAARIRELAAANQVPLVSAPLLARALNVTTELQKEIPAPLYLAVAQVLAFVFQLKQAKRRGRRPPNPPEPDIPEDFIAALRKANRPV